MECIPFACPSCGARMYFVQETKATTYDMWLFSEDGSSLCKNLPLSEALLQEPLLKTEIKTSSFLLCPICGGKYAYDVRQTGPMRAVTECGEKLGTD